MQQALQTKIQQQKEEQVKSLKKYPLNADHQSAAITSRPGPHRDCY